MTDDAGENKKIISKAKRKGVVVVNRHRKNLQILRPNNSCPDLLLRKGASGLIMEQVW